MRLKIIDRFRFFKSLGILILLIFLIISLFPSKIDYDPDYIQSHDLILKLTDTDKEEYLERLTIQQSDDQFAQGDVYLILARMNNNTEHYKKACKNFESYKPENKEQERIKFLTLASLNCKNKRESWLKKADWKETTLKFDTSKTIPKLNLSNEKRITIGKNKIEIKENDLILTQHERVIRDWLTPNLKQSFEGTPLTVFSESNYYSKEELREDLGWHEGATLRDIQDHLDINHKTAVGTIAALNPEDNKWYAEDDKGVFRFSIPDDKIYYPTTRFLTNNTVMIIDTHGINMMVKQAIESKANVVIGCCDYPGKMKAAIYLAENNISVICNTDRFLYQALGYNLPILGSPIMKTSSETVTLGNTPLEIKKHQKIAVLNTEQGYPQQYYDTPYSYFTEINKTFPLKLYISTISDYNQTHRIFNISKDINIVGYRIFNSYDYRQAKEWLKKSKNNKIVLFHSASYPYGKLLTQEFPEQTFSTDTIPLEYNK